MTTLLQDYKKNNPQDAEVPDGALAYILWEKDYKGNADDPVSMEQYAEAVGLDAAQTQEMFSFSNKADMMDQQKAAAGQETEEEDFEASGFQRTLKVAEGATFGWGDELFASVAAIDDVLTEGKDWNTAYKKYQSEYQAQMDEYAKKAPLEAMSLEIAGGFLVPFGAVKTPKVLLDLVTKGSKVKKSAASLGLSTAGGASYGAGSAAPGERVEGGIEGGLFGFGTGAVGNIVFSRVKNAKLKNKLKASNVNVTNKSLKEAKDAAYKAVDESGVKFSQDEMGEIYFEAQKATAGTSKVYDPDFHTHTALALKHLEKKKGHPVTLSELDVTRRHLQELYNKSKGSDTHILDMITSIEKKMDDKFLNNQDNVVQAARVANSRYKKFEAMENAFKQADVSASATPTVAEYRKVVDKLLKSKDSKFYSPEEIKAMEAFIRGSFGQNLLKNFGKFAPGSNGLLSFLHAGAVVAQPGMAALTAASFGARKLSQRKTQQGKDDLLQLMGRNPEQREAVETIMREGTDALGPRSAATAGLLGGMVAP